MSNNSIKPKNSQSNQDFSLYLRQANTNLETAQWFSSRVNNKIFIGWIPVFYFYAAYHYLAAMLTIKNIPVPQNHSGYFDVDKNWVQGTNDLAMKHLPDSVSKLYKVLHTYAVNARYSPKVYELYCNNGVNKTAKNYCDQVRKYVETELPKVIKRK